MDEKRSRETSDGGGGHSRYSLRAGNLQDKNIPTGRTPPCLPLDRREAPATDRRAATPVVNVRRKLGMILDKLAALCVGQSNARPSKEGSQRRESTVVWFGKSYRQHPVRVDHSIPRSIRHVGTKLTAYYTDRSTYSMPGAYYGIRRQAIT